MDVIVSRVSKNQFKIQYFAIYDFKETNKVKSKEIIRRHLYYMETSTKVNILF